MIRIPDIVPYKKEGTEKSLSVPFAFFATFVVKGQRTTFRDGLALNETQRVPIWIIYVEFARPPRLVRRTLVDRRFRIARRREAALPELSEQHIDIVR